MMRRLLLLVLLVLLLPSPSWAQPAAQFYKGTITSNTSTGDQTISGIVDDDGTSFTPKALIVWGTGQASAAVTDGLQYLLGVADCTGYGQIYGSAEDNAATSDTYKESNKARIIDTYDDAGAATSRATLVSCGSGQFVINWSDAPAAADLYHFVAIGGSGVSAKYLAGASYASAATLVEDTSSFIATAMVLLITGSTTSDQAITTEAYNLMVGWWARQSDGGYQQGIANSCTSDNDAAAVTGRFQTATDTLTGLTTSCATFFQRFRYSGNFGVLPVTVNNEAPIALILGGLRAKAGVGLQPTGTGTQAISGVGFKPYLACFASVGAAASTTVGTEARLSLGCATPDAQGHIWIGDLQGADPMVNAKKFSTSQILSMGTPTATGSSSTFEALAEMSSWDSDGVTLNWTAADATQRQYLWIMFGLPATAAGGEHSAVH